MKRHFAPYVAALCCALAILLAACTGGTDAADPDDGTPAVTKPAPDTGDGDAGDDPDTPDTPDDTDEKPENPDNPGKEETDPPAEETNKGLKTILQETLENYNTISEEVSNSITLTAQTIKAVTDISSDLNSENVKVDDVKTKIKESAKEVKQALVAKAENHISVTKKELKEENEVLQGVFEKEDKNKEGGLIPVWGSNLYYIKADDVKISLSGDFDYFNEHIESLEGNIDISELNIVTHELGGGVRILVLTSLLKKEIYEKLNLEGKNVDSLPELSFGLYNDDKEFGLKHFLDICNKYNKSEKLKIDAFFKEMDGRTLVDGVEEYSLFKEVNGEEVAKTSEEDKDTIKYFDINELVEFTDKYHISDISNLIISGDLKETKTVDWFLTNIIFEKDMSNLINESNSYLTGIVYFKGLPYNNREVNSGAGQSVNGVVKLNELNSELNFKLHTSLKSIVDLREIGETKMTGYNPDDENRIFKYMGGCILC